MNKKILFTVLVLPILFGACANKQNDALTIWASNDDTISFVSFFTNKYPEIKVEQINQAGEFNNKLQNVIRVKQRVPDLFFGEVQDLKRYINRDWYLPLENEYDMSELKDSYTSYVWDIGFGDDDKLYALGYQATPVGFFYRKSLAKKYLGTDDTQKISEMLNSWEKVLEVAQLVYNDSQGEVVLFDGLEGVFQAFLATRTFPWVQEGKLIIDQSTLDFMDFMYKAYNEKLTFASPNIWDDTWYGRHTEGKIIGTYLPTWGLRYNLMNVKNAQNDWGVAEVIEPFFWGGNWLGIYKDSQNKEQALLFLKEYASFQSSLNYAVKNQDFPAIIKAQQELPSQLTNQSLANIYQFFSEYVNEVDNKQVNLITQYDGVLRGHFMDVTISYIYNEISKEEALVKFKEDVSAVYPDLVVE